MNPQLAIALALGGVATVTDLRRREIPNWIPLAALVGGLAWQISVLGWWGVPAGLGGAFAGLSVFFIFYLLGGMGGGDVKLMGGFGALLGWKMLLVAALWTAVVGALCACAALAWRAWRRRHAPHQDDFIPYAPAIAAGVCLALWSGA